MWYTEFENTTPTYICVCICTKLNRTLEVFKIRFEGISSAPYVLEMQWPKEFHFPMAYTV